MVNSEENLLRAGEHETFFKTAHHDVFFFLCEDEAISKKTVKKNGIFEHYSPKGIPEIVRKIMSFDELYGQTS